MRLADVLSRRPLLRGLPALLAVVPQLAVAGWQTSLVLTTDYVQRGISQNDGDPALQASITYSSPTGWYAGAWGSQVDARGFVRSYSATASDGADMELNLFAGIGKRLGTDWLVDVKAVSYLYPDDPAPVSYDYFEVAVSVAWRERLYGAFAISPRANWLAYTGGVRNRPAYDTALSMQQPLSPWITWMVGAGYRELVANNVDGYFYGSTSLVMQLKRCTFELGYYDTDRQGQRLFGQRLAGARTAFTASVSF